MDTLILVLTGGVIATTSYVIGYVSCSFKEEEKRKRREVERNLALKSRGGIVRRPNTKTARVKQSQNVRFTTLRKDANDNE